MKLNPKDIEPIPKEELEVLVQQLRNGDNTVKERIIMSHIQMGLSLARRFIASHPTKKDDIVSAAMLGVCQAVSWHKRLVNNSISPYIHVTVLRFIREALEQSHVINVPRGAYKHLREEDLFIPLASYFIVDRDEGQILYQDTILGVKFDDPIKYLELIKQLNLDPHEQILVDRLLQGDTGSNIALLLGVTRARITQIRNGIRYKLATILGIKWETKDEDID